MDSICIVIDLEGFQLSKDSGATFLVREFGWCKWDRTMTGNTHFDHGWCWRDLSEKDQRTVSYAIDRVHQLTFKPGAHEHSLPVSTLPDLVMELHSKFSTPERLVVAYKGGIQEKLLLHKLGLPCLDLEDLGCPRFDQLVDEPGMQRFDCSHHLHMRPDIVPHCPEEECYQFVTWTLEHR